MSEAEFNTAAEQVKKLKSKPSDNDLLELYGLFKQASFGDADPSSRPGLLDLKGKAKWDAWHARAGLSKEQARAAYVRKVSELQAALGMQ